MFASTCRSPDCCKFEQGIYPLPELPNSQQHRKLLVNEIPLGANFAESACRECM